MSPNRRALLVVVLLPFLLASTWLGLALSGDGPRIPDWLLWSGAGLAYILPTLTVMGAGHSPGRTTRLKTIAVLTPCFVAPLSVLDVWSIVPGPLGMGMVGFEFFLNWLTKYPNLGPVNYEILLGILCVLGTGAMPVAFALYALLSKKKRGGVLALWAIGSVVPYLPVLVRLDVSLWWFGAMGLPTFAGELILPTVLYGPMLRTLPLISMGFVLMKRRTLLG